MKTEIGVALGLGVGALVASALKGQNKVTLYTIGVNPGPSTHVAALLVCDETKTAMWIQDPDTGDALRKMFNITDDRGWVTAEAFAAMGIAVVSPGWILWNKPGDAQSFYLP